MDDDLLIEEEIEFNGKPLNTTWNALSHLDYVIGETPISTEVFQPLNQNSFFLLKNNIGLRTIEINITFYADTLYQAKLARSGFNLEVFDGCEIYIPDDGFYYTAVLLKCGAEELVGIGDNNAAIKSTYVFQGFRHSQKITLGPYSETDQIRIPCGSTIPKTCVKITATTHNSSSIIMDTAKLNNLPSGNNVCIVDGIEKKVTVNGQNWMSKTDIKRWPTFRNGINSPIIYTSSSGSPATDIMFEFMPTFL